MSVLFKRSQKIALVSLIILICIAIVGRFIGDHLEHREIRRYLNDLESFNLLPLPIDLTAVTFNENRMQSSYLFRQARMEIKEDDFERWVDSLDPAVRERCTILKGRSLKLFNSGENPAEETRIILGYFGETAMISWIIHVGSEYGPRVSPAEGPV